MEVMLQMTSFFPGDSYLCQVYRNQPAQERFYMVKGTVSQ